MTKKPDYKYSVPSEQRYFDESTSTSTAARVFVAGKTGADYGIKDPDFFIDASGPVAVTGVTVSPTTKSLAVGDTQQIDVTVSPSNATNKAVTFSSSDAAKASVSNTGVITGVAAGTATITVTTADGSKTATVAVTVTGS